MATPFDPKPVNNLQGKVDQMNVQSALGWLEPIDALANRYQAADAAFLKIIQRLTLPIDTEAQGKVSADMHYQKSILDASGGINELADPPMTEPVGGYQDTVIGWGKGIQSVRVQAANPANAGNAELQARLKFPVPPESLTTYAAANNLPPLEVIEK